MQTIDTINGLGLPRQVELIIRCAHKEIDKLKSGNMNALPGCTTKIEWAIRNNWRFKVHTNKEIEEYLNNFMDIDEEYLATDLKREIDLIKDLYIIDMLKPYKLIKLSRSVILSFKNIKDNNNQC